MSQGQVAAGTAKAESSEVRWRRVFTARPYIWFALLGFVLRAAVGLWASGYPKVLGNPYYFGFESGSIARSLFAGEGFSSPFTGATGPTAWVAPVYPLLIAVNFKIFGLFSQGAWNAMVLLNCLFAGLTCIPIYKICAHLGSKKAAAYAALIWAATYSFFHWPTEWIWETSLTALLVTQLLWMSLQLGERPTLRKWTLFGLLWGVSALTNPGVLAVMPVLVLWPLYRARERGEQWLRPLVIVALLFVAIVAPWMVRNQRVFHKAVFIRSNLGFEFWLGNSPMMTGFDEFWKHPMVNNEERDAYVRMGEIAYIESRGGRAREWVKNNPGDFLKLTAKRVIYFWYGTPYYYAAGKWKVWDPENFGFPLFSLLGLLGAGWALRTKVAGALPIASVLLFYPAVYYITYPNARYRHALEPLLLALAVYLVSQAKLRRTTTTA
ncbi:MAG: glycosyltransferase family 39 protein [Terriglobales bacterium]|jgi:4-amino-4-deoxy-L-arabinose transferase-like glycosyltransferase